MGAASHGSSSTLFDWTPKPTPRPEYNEAGPRDIVQEFEEFHAQNPEMFESFKRFAVEALDSGRDRYSARDIFARMRWHTFIETRGDPDAVKINNNWSAFYARMLASQDSRFQRFFEFRKAKVDAEQSASNE